MTGDQSPSEYIKQLERERDTLQAELATANEITRLHCEQGVRMDKELARVREALEDLVVVIQSAGIYQLSNGVELGGTVWFVKCSDAIKQAQAALQPSRGEQG